MADESAVKAIKDLQKTLKELDDQIVRSQQGVAQIGSLIQDGMLKASGSVDAFLKDFRDKIGAAKGEKLRLAVELVGKDGESIQKEIDRVKTAIDNDKGSVVILDKQVKGLDNIKKKYQELLEMQKMLKDPAKFFDQILGIVNKAVGVKDQYSPKTIKEAANLEAVEKLGKAKVKLESLNGEQIKNSELLAKRIQLEQQLQELESKGKNRTKVYKETRSQLEEVNKAANEYLSKLSSYGKAGESALKGLKRAGLISASDRAQIELERQQIDLLKQRNRAEEQYLRLKTQLGNAQLARKATPELVSRTQDAMSRLQERIDTIDKQRVQSYNGFTQYSLQRIEGMYQNHENELTNIKNRGELARRRIIERESSQNQEEKQRQIVDLLKQQLTIQGQIEQLKRAPEKTQQVTKQIQDLNQQYNQLGASIQNIANGDKNLIDQANQQIASQKKAQQNAIATKDAINDSRQAHKAYNDGIRQMEQDEKNARNRIIELMRLQLSIQNDLNRLQNAPANSDVIAQVKNLTAQYNALGQQIQNVANGDQQLIQSARDAIALQDQRQQNAQQTTNAIKASREEQRQQNEQQKQQARQQKQLQQQQNKAESESTANMRRQIEIKARLRELDHNRTLNKGQRTKEEVAEYAALNRELTTLIARQKELNAISPGATARSSAKLESFEASKNTKEAERYNRELEKRKKLQDDNTNATKKQEKALRNVEMTAERLKNALVAAFGLNTIKRFASEIVKIRGEFEMSEVALTNIIGNAEKAQTIWKKTMNLAVNSPLSAMQLTRYVKQLAAFRVETGKLYDTTKMLADVSVGLGVDMERLILAYGHTKSSGFLRGMYARQFATAGVNIYGELAEYYTELEKRTVTFKEVYERISKKLVTFADVEKVFEKITSKGGTFYNMQEELTNTVKGQINKIKDTWQQAMNSIGKSDQGFIRKITDVILNIVKNWRIWLRLIETTTAALIAFKATQFAAALFSINSAAIASSKGMTRLATSIKTLGKSIASNPIGLIVTAITALGTELYFLAKNMRDYNKEIDKNNLTLYNARQKLLDYEDRVKANNAAIEEYGKKANKTKEEQDALSKAQADNASVVSSLRKEYPELAEGLSQQANGYVELTKQIDAHNRSLREQIGLNQLMKQENWFNEGFETDADDYFTRIQKDQAKVLGSIEKMRVKAMAKGIDEKSLPQVLQDIINIDWSNPIAGLERYNQLLDVLFSKNLEKAQLIRDDLMSRRGEYYAVNGGVTTEDIRNSEEYKKFIYEYADAFDVLEGKVDLATHAYKEFTKNFIIPEENEKGEQLPSMANTFALLYLQELRQQIEELPKDSKVKKQFIQWLEEENDNLAEVVLQHGADINKFTEKGLLTANETTRQVLINQGKAITKDRQEVLNDELRVELAFIAKQEELAGIRAQLAAEESKKASKRSVERIAELRKQVKDMLKGVQDEWDAFVERTSGSGDGEEKPPTTPTYKSLDELLNLLKTMNSEYNKLSKSAYGFAKSEETVMKVFRESFKDIFKTTQGMNKLDDVLTMIKFDTLDITSKNGLAGAFQELYDFLEKNNLWTQFGKDADKLRAKLQKTIDMQEVEIGMDVQVKNREDFAKQMEDMFNDYQLTMDLQGLNIDKNLAKEWLGVAYQSLGGMLEEANKFANGLIENKNFSEEDLKTYKHWVDKIENEILKTRKEKTKEYSKYLEKELSERAKKEMEYAVKVAEVQGAQIFTKDQKDSILRNMEKDYTKAMQELTWKSFKESTFYVEMMDDLSSIPADYSNMMLAKINELLMSPQVLSPRAFKEAIKARQRILEALREFKPLEARRKNKSIVNAVFSDESLGLEKRYTMQGKRKELDKEILGRTKNIDSLEEEAKLYEHLTAQVEAYEKAENNASLALKNVNMSLGTNEDEIKKQIDSKQQLLNQIKKEEDRYKELLALRGAGGLDDAQKEELKKLAQSSVERQKEIEGLEVEIKLLNDAKQAVISYSSALGVLDKPENEDALKIITGGSVEMKGGTVVSRASLASQKKENEEQIKNQSIALQKLKDAKRGTTEWARAFHEFYNQIGEMNNKVKGMGDAFYDTYEALGGETNALTEGWKEFGDTMVDVINKALQMIPTLVTGFTSAGVAINSAMGIIGLIAEAVQLVLVAMKAVAKLHDASYERQIEIQQDKIENLQRAYERLEKSLEKTWDTTSYIRVYREETQNLYEQYDALTKQMDAERSKKNADNDKLQDYEDKQQEILDNLEEMKQKQIEVFGGIGEDNYRSAAEEFVSAWKDAFLETGDGLQGLQDHFDEFLNDWFVKQATMRVARAKLDPLFRQIDAAVDRFGVGGSDVWLSELENIRKKFDVVAPQLSKALEELAGSWDLGGEDSLSGLAAGIQGMTEEQANILEAYWNSVRSDTASIAYNVANIARALGVGNDRSNPQLTYLSNIEKNTGAIYSFLQDASKSGHTRGGVGIKVFID